MKRIILLALLIFSLVTARAQSSLKFGIGKGKTLMLYTDDGSVDIEGYNGDTLSIETVKEKETAPAAAEGLFYLPTTKRDVTDSLSYKLQDTLNYLSIWVLGTYRHLHIRVPNNLSYTEFQVSSQMPGAELSLKDYKGEFRLSARMQTVNVSKVTGPFVMSGSAGKTILTDILWQQFPGWADHHSPGHYPYNISIIGNLDVSFPADLKADISAAALGKSSSFTYTGKIYSNLDLGPEKKLNGGGVLIILQSAAGDIYLRKQN